MNFLPGEFERIEESTHRCLAITPAPLMLSSIVVLVEPRIKVCLHVGLPDTPDLRLQKFIAFRADTDVFTLGRAHIIAFPMVDLVAFDPIQQRLRHAADHW
ncbi:hypothetical protein WL00_30725 [Burkholderia cepacia]|nr:hypothetical protein WL00_30725 [Burkholderia cepacia]KVX70377.1 hypothetical protein WL07_19760 [Burkholderia cepacia]